MYLPYQDQRNQNQNQANNGLMVQQNPSTNYMQLAQIMAANRQQQQPQAQQSGGGGGMPGGSIGGAVAKKIIPTQGGGGTGGEGSGNGFGSSVKGVASNPYAWLAALLAWKAHDTKQRSGVDFDDQAKNISLAPQRDFDRWNLEKYGPLGGAETYKGSFDLASGDVSGWWDSMKAPQRAIRDKWLGG